MKPLLCILIILSVISCRSKKTTTDTTIIRDSINTSSFKYVSQPISTTITINDICDSLGVREFKQVESSGTNQAKVYTKDNKLVLDLLTGLSSTKVDTIYKDKLVYKNKNVEVVKYRTPFKIYIIIVLLSLTSILFAYLYIKN